MWEYKRVKITGQSPDTVIQRLNELGAKKWQVIQYAEEDVTFSSHKDSSYLIILKRLVNVPNIT